jgi:hypothetical protein
METPRYFGRSRHFVNVSRIDTQFFIFFVDWGEIPVTIGARICRAID